MDFQITISSSQMYINSALSVYQLYITCIVSVVT